MIANIDAGQHILHPVNQEITIAKESSKASGEQ